MGNLFTAGFEGNDLSEFTSSEAVGTGAVAAALGAAAHDGSYGGHFNTGSADGRGWAWKDSAGWSDSYAVAEWWLYIVGASGTGSVSILEITNASIGNNSIMRLRYNNGTYDVAVRKRDATAYAFSNALSLSTGTWYRIKFVYTNPAAADAVARIYVDGILQQTITDSTTGTIYLNKLRNGARVSGAGAAVECYIDTIVASDDLHAGVSDASTLTDSPTVSVEAAPGAELSINVSDAVSVAEAVSNAVEGAPPDLTLSVSEAATVSEAVTVQVEAAVGDLSVSVSESVAVTDTIDWIAKSAVLARVGSTFQLGGTAISMFGGRFINAAYSDQYVTDFIAYLDTLKDHGVHMISLDFQGGSQFSPPHNAFTSAGALDSTVTNRIRQILNAIADRDMNFLMIYANGSSAASWTDNAALIAGIENATAFLKPWRNGSLYVFNEPWHDNWTTLGNSLTNVTTLAGRNNTYDRIKAIDADRLTYVYNETGSNDGWLVDDISAGTPGGWALSAGDVQPEYARADDYGANAGVFTAQEETDAKADAKAKADAGTYWCFHCAWWQGNPANFTTGGDGLTVGTAGVHWILDYLQELTYNPNPSVSDTVSVGESVSVSIVAQSDLSVNVAEAAIVADSPTVGMDDLAVSVSDAVALAEQTAVAFALEVSASESIAVAEAVEAGAEFNVNVDDLVAAAEQIVAAISDMAVNAEESVGVAEQVTVTIQTEGITLTISVSETASIAEVINVALAHGLSVSDAITVAETVTAAFAPQSIGPVIREVADLTASIREARNLVPSIREAREI